MLKNSKLKRVLVIALLLIMSLTTVAVAANNIHTKQLIATYGRIKFKVDGKDVTKVIEEKYNTPAFVVDDRSYAPVRAIADLMDLEVKWDSKTYTAEIIDTKAENHKKELQKKDSEIDKLEKELKKLQDEIKKLKDGTVDKEDLKTLENKLNKDFKQVDGVNFSIKLKENKDKITITIDIDTKNTSERNAWRKMSNNDKKYIIEDIVDAVSKNFKTFKVDGTLYDNYQKKTLYSFSLSTNGKVSISNKDYGYDDRDRYDDIIYDAEGYLDYYFRDIAKVVQISLRERSNGEIYGSLDIDEDRYRPSDREIEDAFYRTEDDLIRRYGSGTYLDVELYLNGKSYGSYYDGRFR